MNAGIEDSADEESDELLSSVQAGMLLGVGPERMRQLANAGEVPVIHTPLGRLFRMRDVEDGHIGPSTEPTLVNDLCSLIEYPYKRDRAAGRSP